MRWEKKSLQLGLNCSLKQRVLPLLSSPTLSALEDSKALIWCFTEGRRVVLIFTAPIHGFHHHHHPLPPLPHFQHLAFPKKAGKHIEHSSDP